jgi:surface carbohydrate biosynthesis protein
VNIHIVVEVALRELEARLLLGLVAAERGHEVIVGAFDPVADAPLFAPGVFHDKSLTRGKELDRQTALARAGWSVTSQDEEHGLLQSDYRLFMERRFEPEAVANVAAVFTWGPHDTAALRQGHPASTERFVMTGSPRADLWRPELAAYHRALPLPAAPRQPFVLFANNFNHHLGINRFSTMLRDKRGKYFEGFDDELEALWFDEMVAQAERLPHVVAAIRAVALADPARSVVVRPHPTESEEDWRDLIGPLDNVLVSRDGPIGRWIRAARVVVHVGDTTGFEVAVAGVPLVSFEPERGVAVGLDHVTDRLGWRARSATEVVDLVGRAGEGGAYAADGARQARDAELLAGRFAAIEGPLAVDRIVDTWEALPAPPAAGHGKGAAGDAMRRLERVMARRRAEERLRRRVRPAVHAARELRRQLREGPGQPAFRVAHKFPAIDRSDLAATVTAFRSALGRFGDVRAELLGPHVVRLSPRGPRTSSPTGS